MILAVAREHAERALIIMQEFQNQGMSEEELEAAETVVDLDADEATCPGCMTAFTPGVAHCPECGLRVGPS